MPGDEKGVERRSVYRATPEPSGRFEVEVKTASGQCFTGAAVAVSVEGIGVRFRKGRNPVLAIGEPVTLSFRLPHLSHRIELGATPTNCLAQTSYWRYGFQFCDKLEAPAEFSARFYQVFNRRRAYRVEPAAGDIVEVKLVAAGSSATVRLENISATGIALSTDSASAQILTQAQQATLCFRLPDGQELTLVANLRHSHTEDQRTYWGLEFDQARTEQFQLQQQVIMDFVMRRLLEKSLTDAA